VCSLLLTDDMAMNELLSNQTVDDDASGRLIRFAEFPVWTERTASPSPRSVAFFGSSRYRGVAAMIASA
jgi:hypothetical protein